MTLKRLVTTDKYVCVYILVSTLRRKVRSLTQRDNLFKLKINKQVIMNTTINQRVKEIADKLCNGNVSEMARVTGVNQPALRDIVGTKKRKPGFDVLSQIASCATLQINGD